MEETEVAMEAVTEAVVRAAAMAAATEAATVASAAKAVRVGSNLYHPHRHTTSGSSAVSERQQKPYDAHITQVYPQKSTKVGSSTQSEGGL